MRPEPADPPYRAARPPSSKRWLSVFALLVLAAGSGMALLSPAGEGGARSAMGIAAAAGVAGLLWLIRLLYYRLSVHNAHLYARLVDAQQQAWWAQHQQCFAISDVVLLGPAGSDIAHWQRLLRREHRLPEVKNEAGGPALRIPRTLASPADEREARLAKMLVLQWQTQRDGAPLPPLHRCCWQGSLPAWQAFCDQMRLAFPGVTLPDEPEAWRGEESLAAFADAARALPDGSMILVAGCRSVAASPASVLPAGEATVLMTVGREGPVSLTRGEFYDADGQATFADVCLRAVQQSGLECAPEPCMLFSQPALPAPAGWNLTLHEQDLNWGNPGDMEMLIVLALAALCARQDSQPCGWIAKDPLHTLALGIVKPYGQGH